MQAVLEAGKKETGIRGLINLNGKKQGERFAIVKNTLDMIKLNPYMEEEIMRTMPEKLESFSRRNQLIIRLQKPEATEIHGYHDWEELGRKPAGSGKGIFYLAPTTRKNKNKKAAEDPEDITTGFFWVCGWDITDTQEITE